MKPNLVLFKKLSILPSGMITGGFIQYSVDDQTGIVSYSGIISVHMLFFSKDFPLEGSVQLDPNLLLASEIKPGLEYHSNGVQVVIMDDLRASIDIRAPDIGATGIAELDLSEKDISIKKVNLTGTVKGFAVAFALTA